MCILVNAYFGWDESREIMKAKLSCVGGSTVHKCRCELDID